MVHLSAVGCTTKHVCSLSTGNRMDESAIWEKIARQQENCTRRHPCDYLLIVMTYLH